MFNRLGVLGKENEAGNNKCKGLFYSSLGEKLRRSPKEMWEIVKYNGKEDSIIPSVLAKQGYIINDVDKANCFNGYFQSVFAVTRRNILSRRASGNFEALSDISLPYDGIVIVLSELKTNSSAGPDHIPSSSSSSFIFLEGPWGINQGGGNGTKTNRTVNTVITQ